MRIGRRGFLGLLGGAAAALATAPAVEAAAPLFIPSDRLEMGAPKLPASLRAPQTIATGLTLDEAEVSRKLGEQMGRDLNQAWMDSFERGMAPRESLYSSFHKAPGIYEQPLPPSMGDIDPFWDDSPWLQARMDAAAIDGGFVHIPPGIYELGRPLVVPDGVRLHVEDASFIYEGAVGISIDGETRSVIRNNWFEPAKGHSGLPIEVRVPKAGRVTELTLLTDDDMRRARRRLAD